jgi:hypothetical protein
MGMTTDNEFARLWLDNPEGMGKFLASVKRAAVALGEMADFVEDAKDKGYLQGIEAQPFRDIANSLILTLPRTIP